MEIAKFLALAETSEEKLADSFMHVANAHDGDAEVSQTCKRFAEWSRRHSEALGPAIKRFGTHKVDEPARVRSALFHGTRIGGVGLLRDLHDLSLLARQADLNWTSIEQAAKSLHDDELQAICGRSKEDLGRQLAWLDTQIKQTAPQALTVDPAKGATIKASIPKTITPAAIPELIWSPVASAFLVILVGAIGCLAGKPWLIPSLGPTAYLQGETPAHPASRFYNTVVGHVIGLGMGFAAVAMFNAWQSPGVLTDHQLVWPRVAASAVALFLTMLVALLLKASHPPAGATTLLVTLGALRTVQDAISALVGVLTIALFGIILRRARLKAALARPG
jgi:hypothetical protein